MASSSGNPTASSTPQPSPSPPFEVPLLFRLVNPNSNTNPMGPYHIRPFMPPVISYPNLNNPIPNCRAGFIKLFSNNINPIPPSKLEPAVPFPPPQNPRPILHAEVSQEPQLEVVPIMKYNAVPKLALGRQIAVNLSYIVYGLKLGCIRVLNIKTTLSSLLRGHTQRVRDMVFFAEDVHFLASASEDGKIFVWKIEEGPDEKNKPHLMGKIVIALQVIGDSKSYHPCICICWHPQTQEILYVGIGNRVLKIDITKMRRGKKFSAEEPLKCPIEELSDGVSLVGQHDGDVTDLSICHWLTTRLVSASKDGMVKIWDERYITRKKTTVPLATLIPHDGLPVNSVSFLTAPKAPNHINLVTTGPLNREIKVWSSTSKQGWLLPSDSESWQCTQTLDLISLEPCLEASFFDEVVVLPQAHLIILTNTIKNIIYAIHVDYGICPASTRMDYIADYTAEMPILSLVRTLHNGEQVEHVFCVQTMAIQQDALEHCSKN